MKGKYRARTTISIIFLLSALGVAVAAQDPETPTTFQGCKVISAVEAKALADQ